ncbi:MAG: hypothetical protein CL910_14675 [Deltaproteobacteria bacterium]|nr:hypothetical protein [Deltaproteobacteria bacterium]
MPEAPSEFAASVPGGETDIFGSPPDEMLSWVAHLATEAHHDVATLAPGRDRLLADALLDALKNLMDHFTPGRSSNTVVRACVSGIAWIVDGRALQVETFASLRGGAFDHVLRSCCCFLRSHLAEIRGVVFSVHAESPQGRAERLAELFRKEFELPDWEAHGIATLTLVLLSSVTDNALVGMDDDEVIENIVTRCLQDADSKRSTGG